MRRRATTGLVVNALEAGRAFAVTTALHAVEPAGALDRGDWTSVCCDVDERFEEPAHDVREDSERREHDRAEERERHEDHDEAGRHRTTRRMNVGVRRA